MAIKKTLPNLDPRVSLLPNDLFLVGPQEGGEEQRVYLHELEDYFLNPTVLGRVVTTNITLSEADAGMFLEFTSPVEVTIPTTASVNLPEGFIVHGYNHSTGDLTFEATSITLKLDEELEPVVLPNGTFSLMKSRAGLNTWILYGNLKVAE